MNTKDELPLSGGAIVSDIGAKFIIESFATGKDQWDVAGYLDRIDEWEQGDDILFDWRECKVNGYGLKKDERRDLGNGWNLRAFIIERESPRRILTMLTEGAQRDPGYSLDDDDVFVALYHHGVLWMSDTRAEIMEHYPVVNRINEACSFSSDVRVLINGLGLGVITNYVLQQDEVTHIDVVEIDESLIQVMRTLLNDPDGKVVFHCADAFKIEWPQVHEDWDVAWHDVWPSISEDNIPQMEALFEKYEESADAQDAWQYQRCLEMKEEGDEFAAALRAGNWERVRQLDPNF